jgi:hypothetical protein
MTERCRLAYQLLAVTAIATALYAPAVAFNVVVDPYGVFHRNASFAAVVPNERFVKLRFLLDHPNQFDTFIFGDSRQMAFDPALISPRAYNLWQAAASPATYLHDLRLLLTHGIMIQRIFNCAG